MKDYDWSQFKVAAGKSRELVDVDSEERYWRWIHQSRPLAPEAFSEVAPAIKTACYLYLRWDHVPADGHLLWAEEAYALHRRATVLSFSSAFPIVMMALSELFQGGPTSKVLPGSTPVRAEASERAVAAKQARLGR